uniref:Cytochrome P450 n=1 Tax=Moniliophthora roreri TaxID=221103 RepID=A0A0W0FD55_MONRR
MSTFFPSYLFPLPLLFVACAIIYRIVRGCIHPDRGPRLYPPGPKPKRLLGNLLDYPEKNAAETYRQWGKIYHSNILFTTALQRHTVILNNLRDGDELLGKRSRLYSDRPVVPMLEMIGWDYNMSTFHYEERWRRHRKVCQQNFGPEAVKAYYPILTCKVHELMSELFSSPDDFETHSRKLSLAIPMATMFGYDIDSVDDPCIVPANTALSLAENVMSEPMSALANFFPIIRFIAGPGFRKRVDKVRQATAEMKRLPIEFVTKNVSDGTATYSLLSDFLQKKLSSGATPVEEEAVRNVAYTTHSATVTFFYLMAVNPGVQRRAQEEIDQIIGRHRFPEFEDRPLMPYIEAIYREVLRWKPPVPLGVPHCLTEDDFCNEYFIPKGTTVFANIWAMTRDEGLYPNANQFLPERFFDQDGQLNDDNRVLAYGFGRRACAGKHVASSTLWLLIASTLALFKIDRAKNDRGEEIRIKDDYIERGALVHKAPFRCSFMPRSDEAERLVHELNLSTAPSSVKTSLE